MQSTQGVAPYWLTVFLDEPTDQHGAALEFWSAVTGSRVSPPRGDDGEFVTLLPAEGDPHVKVQRTASGHARRHLDLHVRDVAAAAGQAVTLGATRLGEQDGYVVLESPGGLVHCLVDHAGGERGGPVRWPEGHRSVVDQLCLDVASAHVETEVAYWSGLTGWAATTVEEPEFRRLAVPTSIALRLLVQRLDDGNDDDHDNGTGGGAEPTTTAHLDLSTDDVATEVARHERLGARVVERSRWWTVMASPTGEPYCVTARDPG